MADERLPAPGWLRLELSVDLSSRQEDESDDFGWDSWRGSIVAGWEVDVDLEPAHVGALTAEFPREIFVEDGEITVHVGGCELMVLHLDEGHPVFGDQVAVGPYGPAIYDAGDALAQDLADVLGPLTQGAADDPFIQEVMDASEIGWYDSLVLLRSIGIHERFRGEGIGAWAAARAIMQLARSETALVALKAAPLNRTKFLSSIEVADPEAHRDLSPAEAAAWDAACVRIAANWQKSLGLASVTHHPGVLFAPGGQNKALVATLRRF
ncbi:hypothetical protein [Aeromicrobium sp. 179-A 4D2 NHS]|uniref:hypothetical protein n=1 Tax=Aeromicrobium sp. 179-A 4D2 NHS TaxID=3142375 RepID=UPI0039A1595D